MSISAIWHYDGPAEQRGPTLLARIRPFWRRRPRQRATVPQFPWPPSPDELQRVEQRIANLRRILAVRDEG